MKQNKVQAVEALIAARVRIDAKDYQGMTALIHAADTGKLLMVKILCDADASAIDEHDPAGYSALLRAVINGHLPIVREILKHQPNLEMKDPTGKSPLLLALSHACGESEGSVADCHFEIAAVLLEAGADIQADIQTTDGGTLPPLHYFCHIGKPSVVKWLLQWDVKVDINSRRPGDEGWTPLIECAASAQPDGAATAMQLLVDAGADPAFHLKDTRINTTSFTALCKACQLGHLSQVEILIKAGANVSSQTHSGYSPLAETAINNRPEIIHLLLDHGAYVHPRDHRDRTPLLLACMSDPSAPECVQLLLDHGANAEAQNESGWTPLMEACSRNFVDVVLILLKAGAEPDRRNVNKNSPHQGWTALMFAAERDHLDAFRTMLVEGNADTGAKNARGQTVEAVAGKRVCQFLKSR